MVRQFFQNCIAESGPMKMRLRSFIRFALAVAAMFISSISSRADVVYVWSYDGTIQRFNANGAGSLFATNNLSGWNGPVGLALDNVGNLYAGVPSESYIWRFSPDGNSSLAGLSVDSVSGVAFDSTGNLYATIPNYIALVKLDYSFGHYWLSQTNCTQSHLSYPINLAFDSAGNIYVANNTNANPYASGWPPSPYDNTIEEFSSNFTDLGAFATNLNNPWGLAFDSSGNLYVTSSGSNRIYKFLPGGVRTIFAAASSGLSGPRGLAFDSGGNLYVANSGNGTIEMFTPNATHSLFASGLSSPSSIAIFPGLKLWSATAITLDNPKAMPSGSFQFNFTDNAGLAFVVLGATNVSSSLTNWTALGGVTEVSPGQYQFTDSQTTNSGQRFYRIRSN